VSAGTGIRHAEYNLEQTSARIFQMWITPASSGGSPAWGIEYVLREPRLAYLVPSSGTVDVNGVRIHARDGAAIKDVDIVTITAFEDADVVMVDVL
jgi:quercetin 2,3-dioxygenase